ncbi:cyclase family protein [Arthrobacter sp. ATA002]|uniref:cyclase family protein n=1 Tax=Arthrobacter sp. ATA002 TaxID=2991715 RepID=UPI0022A6B3EA|nr:cyclase family protein [Arthrobacter sp. ATA002]WAP50993.1 cyclase family protein [Arthrobacter sp. ATA002]
MSAVDKLTIALGEGAVQILDLTTPLSRDTPILNLPEPFANTVGLSLSAVSRFDDAGPAWAWNDVTVGEHAGTHLDAPVHWISGRDGKSVDQIEPARLIGPAVVIDKTAEVAQNPDFLLEPADFEQWEEDNGPFPDNCWIIFRTGWSARGSNAAGFINADDGGSHTPGVSPAGARWIAANNSISGFGVETVGIDAGQAASFDPMFPVHSFLLGADKYGITSLRNVDKLPTTGSTLIVAPLPIVGGTGSPARVFALVDAP